MSSFISRGGGFGNPANTDLDMATNDITNAGTVTATSFVGTLAPNFPVTSGLVYFNSLQNTAMVDGARLRTNVTAADLSIDGNKSFSIALSARNFTTGSGNFPIICMGSVLTRYESFIIGHSQSFPGLNVFTPFDDHIVIGSDYYTTYLGQFVDIVATYDAATGYLRVYVEGVLSGPYENFGPMQIPTSAEIIVFGSRMPDWNASVFNGQIKNLAIFNRVLTDAEVLTIHNGL